MKHHSIHNSVDKSKGMEVIDDAKQYWSEFHTQLKTIRTDFEEVEATWQENKNIAKSIFLLKESLSNVQSFATEYADMLPSYDVRRSQEVSCYQSLYSVFL